MTTLTGTAAGGGPTQNTILEEWKATIEVAKHFNDLLMRLRSFGLPLLVTAGAGGFALSLRVEINGLRVWCAGGILMAIAVLMSASILYVRFTPGWGKPSDALKEDEVDGNLNGWEWFMLSLPLILSWLAVASFWILVRADQIHLSAPITCTAGIPVLLLALGVIIVLYTLDRFYYYKLLLGAVSRATLLEHAMSMNLTAGISRAIPARQSAVAVTLLYLLPGLSILCVALLMLVANPFLEFSVK